MTAVLAAGLSPVLVDVDPDSLNLAPHARGRGRLGHRRRRARALRRRSRRPRVHELCSRADVPVVEDAAPRVGAVDHRGLIRGAGCVAACFSFGSTGNITSGEGGALVTDRADVAARAAAPRLHGLTRDAWARFHPDEPARYGLLEPGAKANLPDLLAALGRSQPRASKTARNVAGAWSSSTASSSLPFPASARCPSTSQWTGRITSSWWLCPTAPTAIVCSSDCATAACRRRSTSRRCHHFDWFRAHAEIGRGGLAVADAHAERVLSLPLHAEMTLGDVERVVTTLGGALSTVPTTA